jgi:hypothetical protein
MITAAQARQQGKNSDVITQEIAIISIRILDAVSLNQFATTVSASTSVEFNGTVVTGSIMTNADSIGESYYNVWQGTVTDSVKLAQMTEVIAYFSNQGYNITRLSTSGTEFYWSIAW